MQSSSQETIFTCRHCGAKNRIENKKAAESPQSVKCGQCKGHIFPEQYTPIQGLLPGHYQHPLDKTARTMLQKIPGIETVLKVLLREGIVKYHQLLLQQNSIQVTQRHLNNYYQMLERSAGVLGIEKLPTFYIQQSPVPNAFTFGADDHVIVLTTSLIDLHNEQEIESVIAHELGHIHCDHVLYKTAARILSTLAVELASRLFGLAASMIYPIVYGLLYWDRTSELTADRAEILVNQSYRTSVSALIKLAGGSQKLNKELDVDLFLDQAEQTSLLTESNFLLKIYHILQEANSTHHFATWRAKLIREYAFSSEALLLMSGQIPESTKDVEKNDSEQKPDDDPIGVDDIVSEFKKLFNF